MDQIGRRDNKAERREYFFCAPQTILDVLKDDRDAAVMNLLFNAAIFIATGIFFLLYTKSHVVGLLYFIILFTQLFERFVLALHFSSHKPLSHTKAVNRIPEFWIAPFFGIPSGMYSLHHIAIHHVHGNESPYDISSTEPYQRDKISNLVAYCIRFVAFSAVEIPWNFCRQGKNKDAVICAATIFFNVMVVRLVIFWFPLVAFWTLVMPFLTAPLFLACGNFCQHIFINKEQASSPFGITYCLVDSPNNQKTFNDGYHVEHHIMSTRHWSDLPKKFMERINEYEEHDALVFCGDVSFLSIGYLVFTENYDRLYEILVQFESNPRSRQEVEKMLRERLMPVQRWGDGKLIK